MSDGQDDPPRTAAPVTVASKPLVLCLGNEIISDDGFGPEVARRLRYDEVFLAVCDVQVAALAGFALLDLLRDRAHALVVDAITDTGSAPGTLHFFADDAMAATRNLVGSHQMSLPVALAMGRQLNYALPAAVDVLACQVHDVTTLREALTPRVAKAVPAAVRRVRQWVAERCRSSAPEVAR